MLVIVVYNNPNIKQGSFYKKIVTSKSPKPTTPSIAFLVPLDSQ